MLPIRDAKLLSQLTNPSDSTTFASCSEPRKLPDRPAVGSLTTRLALSASAVLRGRASRTRTRPSWEDAPSANGVLRSVTFSVSVVSGGVPRSLPDSWPLLRDSRAEPGTWGTTSFRASQSVDGQLTGTRPKRSLALHRALAVIQGWLRRALRPLLAPRDCGDSEWRGGRDSNPRPPT